MKDEGESLQSLTNRIEEAMLTCQNLRPPSFSLADLDNELQAMAMIRALPREQYASFTSALIMMLPEKLDKSKVIEAFQTEELNRMARPSLTLTSSSSSSVALAATSSPSTSISSASANAASADATCDFCGRKGHTQSVCFKFAKAKEKARQPRKRPDQANATESAGNASLRSVDPSDPLSPLQTDANMDWNADSGATAHMTPH